MTHTDTAVGLHIVAVKYPELDRDFSQPLARAILNFIRLPPKEVARFSAKQLRTAVGFAAVAFTPDGRFLATVGMDAQHTIAVVDWREGTRGSRVHQPLLTSASIQVQVCWVNSVYFAEFAELFRILIVCS